MSKALKSFFANFHSKSKFDFFVFWSNLSFFMSKRSKIMKKRQWAAERRLVKRANDQPCWMCGSVVSPITLNTDNLSLSSTMFQPVIFVVTKIPCNYSVKYLGSGCGAVGRAVASDTRDPWFEFSHRQHYLLSAGLKSPIERTKVKKKRGQERSNLKSPFTRLKQFLKVKQNASIFGSFCSFWLDWDVSSGTIFICFSNQSFRGKEFVPSFISCFKAGTPHTKNKTFYLTLTSNFISSEHWKLCHRCCYCCCCVCTR